MKLFVKLRVYPAPTPWGGVRRMFNNMDLLKEHLTDDVKLKIESKYKDRINVTSSQNTQSDKPKYYVLSMFPYPSGTLHMGHVRVYTISDTLARYHALNGKQVFQPMGWDGFGLPAENAAQEHQVDPSQWTKDNIAAMKQQMEGFGCQFNWESELATCDPQYYKWTQALFLDMYEAGLVYRKEAFVNWDPVDKTVLADEQVDSEGRSWRSGAKVEKRTLSQWFVRTTQLAKDLYEGLSDPLLEDWKDIIYLQKHWIGEPNGVSFDLNLVEPADGVSGSQSGTNFLNVWIPEERIEHIGNTPGLFIGVKSGHYLVRNKTEGSGLLGYVRNPFTSSQIPILISDAIEYDAGREEKLCLQCDGIEETRLSKQYGIDRLETYTKQWSKEEICSFAQKSRIGGYPVSSKLRDWLISRQRYWGTPIPMVHCASCGTLPVPRSSLPITLPQSPPSLPLSHHKEWLKVTHCPQCKGDNVTRDSDTMDTFVDSSWYYARYLDPSNTSCSFPAAKAQFWLPVDLYVGGKEHAVLHLYYARFVAHFLHAQGKTPTREPFKRLLVQGMIMGQTFREKSSGKYLKPDEIYTEGGVKKSGKTEGGTVYSASTREPVTVSWEKMSKSKYNGVNPAYLVQQYGVDTMRLFVLCDVAPTSQKNWTHAAFPGILNWQVKLWLLIKDYLHNTHSPPPPNDLNQLTKEQTEQAEHKLCAVRNQTVRSVTYAYSRNHQLNAAICRLQSYTTSLRNTPPSIKASSSLYSLYIAELLTMLAPMTPHLSCFLWECCKFPGHLWDTSEPSWPQVDDHWTLSFRVLIHKKSILNLPIIKSELVKLNKGTALELFIEQVRANKKNTMRSYQYLLDIEQELRNENQDIQFSIDPNDEAVLTLPFTMMKQRAKPDETTTETTTETEDTVTREHG